MGTPEYHKQYNKEWYARNKATRAAQIKAYYEANKDAVRLRQKKYRAVNRERCLNWTAEWVRANRGRVAFKAFCKRFNIDEVLACSLLKKTRCAVCDREPAKGRLGLDHNHRTGKIRDMLCQQCNAALGMVDDSISKLKKLVQYLEQHGDYNE